MDKKETMKQRKKMLEGNEKSDDKEKERERGGKQREEKQRYTKRVAKISREWDKYREKCIKEKMWGKIVRKKD